MDTAMIEDAELLRRYVEQNSEEAFAELVQRHIGLVYACALRRVGGNSQLAEDVTQQVFIDVARRAAPLARRPVLAGWLFTSARFAAAKALRSARRRLAREQEAHTMETLTRGPAAPIDWDAARPVLDDAIGELSERDREAILLRFFEGRDFAAIGSRLRLSDNAARMRVERALHKLRDRLAHRGVTSTAAVIATVLAQQTATAVPAGLVTTVTSAALASGALAMGAAAGSSVVVAFMSVSKLQIGLTGALLVAGASGFVFQAQHLAGLRSEIATLEHQNLELAALATENERLKSTAAEVAALREDDAAFTQLSNEATALQAALKRATELNAANRTTTVSRPRPAISQRTSEALQTLKAKQEAKDWAGMMAVIDGLIPQLSPTSYDMAYVLDVKAKIFLQQDQYAKAIEPWEQALKLSEQYQYFDPKMSYDIASYLTDLRYQNGSGMPLPPVRGFF